MRVSRVAMREWTLAIITPMEGNMSGRSTTTCREESYRVYAETSIRIVPIFCYSSIRISFAGRDSSKN